jgi:hypothetical protein
MNFSSLRAGIWGLGDKKKKSPNLLIPAKAFLVNYTLIVV